jgi:hypothetical protein
LWAAAVARGATAAAVWLWQRNQAGWQDPQEGWRASSSRSGFHTVGGQRNEHLWGPVSTSNKAAPRPSDCTETIVHEQRPSCTSSCGHRRDDEHRPNMYSEQLQRRDTASDRLFCLRCQESLVFRACILPCRRTSSLSSHLCKRPVGLPALRASATGRDRDVVPCRRSGQTMASRM